MRLKIKSTDQKIDPGQIWCKLDIDYIQIRGNLDETKMYFRCNFDTVYMVLTDQKFDKEIKSYILRWNEILQMQLRCNLDTKVIFNLD